MENYSELYKKGINPLYIKFGFDESDNNDKENVNKNHVADKIKREDTYFYHMRVFHNNIKRDLYARYAKGVNNLLELSSGKSGDLQKWISNRIKNVEGYDINSDSINEGNRRYENSPQKDQINVKLHVKDLSTFIIHGNKEFDVVASMFAFHYMFKDKESFDTIIESIDNNLKIGGVFMGTMFDGKLVRDKIEQCFSTDMFKINVKNDNPKEMFGNKISVILKETVLDVGDEGEDEYIVDFERLVEIMNSRGYILIESRNFREYSLILKPQLKPAEKECSYLNRTFIFKRIR